MLYTSAKPASQAIVTRLSHADIYRTQSAYRELCHPKVYPSETNSVCRSCSHSTTRIAYKNQHLSKRDMHSSDTCTHLCVYGSLVLTFCRSTAIHYPSSARAARQPAIQCVDGVKQSFLQSTIDISKQEQQSWQQCMATGVYTFRVPRACKCATFWR